MFGKGRSAVQSRVGFILGQGRRLLGVDKAHLGLFRRRLPRRQGQGAYQLPVSRPAPVQGDPQIDIPVVHPDAAGVGVPLQGIAGGGRLEGYLHRLVPVGGVGDVQHRDGHVVVGDKPAEGDLEALAVGAGRAGVAGGPVAGIIHPPGGGFLEVGRPLAVNLQGVARLVPLYIPHDPAEAEFGHKPRIVGTLGVERRPRVMRPESEEREGSTPGRASSRSM